MTRPTGGTAVGGTAVGGTGDEGPVAGGGVRIGPGSELPVGEGRAYVVEGEQVAVFRLGSGALRAVSAICPHAGGPLADGQIDDQVVICPLHLNVFELDTGCSRSGQPDLRSYPVHEGADGQLIVAVSSR
jgi:nitrite reductase/ring-hydroxylating ferredoxin subunit